MIQTQNILSLTDFQRNTASHVRALRETGLPKVLTVKGRAELIVQTAGAYQALLSKLELYESAMGVRRGLEDVARGKSSSLADFDRRMRSRFRLRSRAR
jgi:PHD/YefM family antitoxin component YafN of YafNO toxin-antitoxin module